MKMHRLRLLFGLGLALLLSTGSIAQERGAIGARSSGTATSGPSITRPSRLGATNAGGQPAVSPDTGISTITNRAQPDALKEQRADDRVRESPPVARSEPEPPNEFQEFVAVSTGRTLPL